MHLTYHDEPDTPSADRPTLSEIKVTPAMLAAGIQCLADSCDTLDLIARERLLSALTAIFEVSEGFQLILPPLA